jgi:two-component system, OmpR family, response regulator
MPKRTAAGPAAQNGSPAGVSADRSAARAARGSGEAHHRILIVEDDPAVASGVAAGLAREGFTTVSVDSGERALDEIPRAHFDVVVLDLWLPGIDGFEVLKRLRAAGHTVPVLCLTARHEVEARVQGLSLGADDYLVKPFALPELVARVGALMRRQSVRAGKRVAHGALEVDYSARRAFLNGELLMLADREWLVLAALAEQIGKTVSKEAIVEALGEQSRDGDVMRVSMHAIEIYVSKLRAKLEPAGVRIRAIRGYGYLMLAADGR